MNKKAFQLIMVAFIVIVLGLVLIVGLYLALKGGLNDLDDTTGPLSDTARASAIRQACSLACENGDRLTYCCEKQDIDDGDIICNDSRLEIECGFSCEGFSCE